MTPELERALKRHTQWFGSYKASGELKKIQVWLNCFSGRPSAWPRVRHVHGRAMHLGDRRIRSL